MKSLTTKCMAFVILLALLWPLAGQAQFSPNPTSVYKIVNRSTGKALEIGYDNQYDENHLANQWTYWGGSNQQWKFEYISTKNGRSYYKIINRNSGRVLASDTYVRPETAPTFNDLVAIQQWYTNKQNQQWIVEPAQNAAGFVLTCSYFGVKLTNIWGTSTVENTNVYCTNGWGPSDHERWDIIEETTKIGPSPFPGVFTISSARSNMVLAAVGKSVQQNSNQNWGSQQWTFASYPNNTVAIINRNSTEALELGGGGDLNQPGHLLNTWPLFGNDAQLWQLLDVNTGAVLTFAQATDGRRCKIRNVLSGQVMEIGGGGSVPDQEGSGANQWYNNANSSNQEWTISYLSANRPVAPTTPSANNSQPVISPTKTQGEESVYSLTLSPNPAQHLLSLTGLKHIASVQVTDSRGARVSVSYGENGQVNIADLAPGLYLIAVSDGQHLYQQRFVKN